MVCLEKKIGVDRTAYSPPALLVCLAFSVALAACGGGGPSSEGAFSGTDQASAPAASPVPPEPDQPAPSPEEM
jgi:hypothetical protein